MKKKQLTFIDLFAGCGGLSLGLVSSGWRGLFAVEKSTDAFQTFAHNLCSGTYVSKFDWPEWLPFEPMTTSDLIKEHGDQLKKLRGKVDLVAGGPPCQGFSSIGLRNPNDPRNKLTEEYIKIVQLVRPKMLLLENVRGFQTKFTGKRKAHSQLVKEKLEKLQGVDYQVFTKMVEASKFGVPQRRPRFIMIAVRADLLKKNKDPFEYLDAYLPVFKKKLGLSENIVSVKDAIDDLRTSSNTIINSQEHMGFNEIKYTQPPNLSNFQKLMREGVESAYKPNSLRLANHKQDTIKKFEHILKKCPKGITLSAEHKNYYKMKKQCFTPLHPDKLSKTLTTLPDDLLHYSEPRILTVRESARLQSFPDWFEFKGKYTTGGKLRKQECPRYTQVGNAVPPLMSNALGDVIKKWICNGN